MAHERSNGEVDVAGRWHAAPVLHVPAGSDDAAEIADPATVWLLADPDAGPGAEPTARRFCRACAPAGPGR